MTVINLKLFQTSQVSRIWGESHGLTMRHENLTVNRFTSRWNTLFEYFQFCLVKLIIRRQFCRNPTLGARGFSCAVSGFGLVLKSDPREKLRRSCLRPAADKTKLPVRTREKTSGTQCIEIHDSKAYLYLNFSVISTKLTNVEILSKY